MDIHEIGYQRYGEFFTERFDFAVESERQRYFDLISSEGVCVDWDRAID